jgi:energy-coupling factor transporter ATP-binding protein EcfA2
MQHLVQGLHGQAIYLPGSRPSNFGDETLNMTPLSRKHLEQNLQNWDRSPDERWRSHSGTARNEKAIHDLSVAETKFKVDAANEIAREGKDSVAVARLQSGASPLDRVNILLKQGNLPVSVTISGGELRAARGDSSYSIARMSDGERTALVLIAEVVVASAGSVFVIDEPELHLHRAIIVPLVTSLIREKSDSTFIISTHELEVLAGWPQSSIAIVRGSTWVGGCISAWQVDTIDNASELPEDVRVDILGSRGKLLFIEGTNSSLDGPLYTLMFPNASVRSRESCREVERAVSGLRAIEDLHHTNVFGMIDRDAMSPEQVTAFETKGIYPLPVHAVESLYYAEEVLYAIAVRQGETFGEDPNVLLDDAKAKGLAALDVSGRIPHLASRVAERQLRDALFQRLPDRADLISQQEVSVSLPSPYPAEFRRLEGLRSNNDIAAIISRYPVRESSLLDAVAKALKFAGRADYEKAVLSRLSADEQLLGVLVAKLGALAPQLA